MHKAYDNSLEVLQELKHIIALHETKIDKKNFDAKTSHIF